MVRAPAGLRAQLAMAEAGNRNVLAAECPSRRRNGVFGKSSGAARIQVASSTPVAWVLGMSQVGSSEPVKSV